MLILAALVLAAARHHDVDDYHQLPLLLIPVSACWGFVLFFASLGIACLGAALEIALQQAYLVAQGFGWNWGEDLKPRDDAGFASVYTGAILISARADRLRRRSIEA